TRAAAVVWLKRFTGKTISAARDGGSYNATTRKHRTGNYHDVDLTIACRAVVLAKAGPPKRRRCRSLRLGNLPSLLCKALLLQAIPAACRRRNDRRRHSV